MPINVTWLYEEHTVIHYAFVGEWTWEEFYDADKVAYTMIQSIAPNSADLIVDLSQSKGVPNGILSHVRSLFGRNRKGWGITAVLGPSRFYMVLMDMIRRLSPELVASFFIVESVDDALKHFDDNRMSA